jgi:hypothetical protein
MCRTRRCLLVALVIGAGAGAGAGALAPGAQAATRTEIPSLPVAAGGSGGLLMPPPPRPLPQPPLPQRPPLKPTFTFPPKSRPPVVGGVARRRGRFVRIDVSGSLTPPAGVRAAAACTGSVALTVSKPRGKRRTLTRGSARLSRTCRYKKLLRVRRSRIGTLRSLKLTVAFTGNVAVAASSVTYAVPVRR